MKLHKDLFIRFLEYKVDGIFTYGNACQKAIHHILDKGFSNVYSFESHKELAKSLKNFLKPGDVVLIKGSRGMQMEKVLAYL